MQKDKKGKAIDVGKLKSKGLPNENNKASKHLSFVVRAFHIRQRIVHITHKVDLVGLEKGLRKAQMSLATRAHSWVRFNSPVPLW